MAKKISVPEQLARAMDKFEKAVEGKSTLIATLERVPPVSRNMWGDAGLLPSIIEMPRLSSFDSIGGEYYFEWMDFRWKLGTTGTVVEQIAYASFSSSVLAIVSDANTTTSGVPQLIPSRVLNFDAPADLAGHCCWTAVLFWLAFVIHDAFDLDANVVGRYLEKTPPLKSDASGSYTFTPGTIGLMSGIREVKTKPIPECDSLDSPKWPEYGYAYLNYDLFAASRHACNWLLEQIAPHGTNLLGEQQEQPDDSHQDGGQDTKTSDEPGMWLKVSEVEEYTGMNRGVISRAASAGELASNGKRWRDRRISLMGLIEWLKKRNMMDEVQEVIGRVPVKLRNK